MTMNQLLATLCGEMAANEIPLARGVDLAQLKSGDSDPLEVVVSLPAGKSTRGWNYTPEAVKRIAEQVATKTAAGYLGHQDPEKVEREFRQPVTHWVGAKWDPFQNVAYFRGVVDAAAADLKRWIRSGRITQTSIFGEPKLQHQGSNTLVTDYRLLSIDWTPLHLAGMDSRIVAMGEMEVITSTPATPSGLRRVMVPLDQSIGAPSFSPRI
jgi:hypothetical protein